MPVTLVTANHIPRSWSSDRVTSSDHLFRQSCPKESSQSLNIIQSSVSRRDLREKYITSSSNGLVSAAINAYSEHHHLVIRPEDVWFAVLSQLSFYINAHAEEYREYFVSHEGQKELEMIGIGSIKQVDFGVLARRMTDLIQENVKIPEFRSWIMPSFSTTTDCDRTVAAILMMGSMQKYFSYKMTMKCGIPSVTILGEREDWQDIMMRLEKLTELGSEPTNFAKLLKPVIQKFMDSFDEQPLASTMEFWGKIAHEEKMGSGTTFLSGWITAFCFWDEAGKSLYANFNHPHWPGCQLDGVKYHKVDTDKIPSGFASVPVTVDDNGKIYHTKMLAGSIGILATSSGGMAFDAPTIADFGQSALDDFGRMAPVQNDPDSPTEDSGLDTLQPLSGWFMYESNAPATAEPRQVPTILPNPNRSNRIKTDRRPKRAPLRAHLHELSGGKRALPPDSSDISTPYHSSPAVEG